MENRDMNQEKSITIGELVTEDYRRAEIFEKFDLDFCCGGNKTVEEASMEKGIDPEEVSKALKSLDDSTKDTSIDFGHLELDELINYILDNHHKYVAEALPILEEFSTKVAQEHGGTDPEVVDISTRWKAIANELRLHMHKEEAILFPFIREMVAARKNHDPVMPPPFGTVRNPISVMAIEHDSAGNVMHEIKELSHDYTPPEHACNTYRALYAKLKEFEDDLHHHIHLENNILFPKAIALESKLM